MTSNDFQIGSEVWPGLGKLVEECGELQQVLGKLIATGGRDEHWDGTNLRVRLVEELGDVLAAAGFLVEYNGLDRESVEERADAKLKLFNSWHNGQ